MRLKTKELASSRNLCIDTNSSLCCIKIANLFRNYLSYIILFLDMSTTTSSIPTLTGISRFNSFSNTFSAFGVNTKWSKNCVKSRISRYRCDIATHNSPHAKYVQTGQTPEPSSIHTHSDTIFSNPLPMLQNRSLHTQYVPAAS